MKYNLLSCKIKYTHAVTPLRCLHAYLCISSKEVVFYYLHIGSIRLLIYAYASYMSTQTAGNFSLFPLPIITGIDIIVILSSLRVAIGPVCNKDLKARHSHLVWVYLHCCKWT